MRIAPVIIGLAFLLASCGDPAGPGDGDFVFTPIPYKTFEGAPPVSVDENCQAFVANEVIVTLDPAAEEQFDEWLDEYGFERQKRSRSNAALMILVDVPLGSVLDAVDLISEQDGVIAAGPQRTRDAARRNAGRRTALRVQGGTIWAFERWHS